MIRNNLLIFVNSDHTYTFTVEPDNETPLSENSVFYLQMGMLYTNFDGSRRIRVFNYSLSICNAIEEYFEEMDAESVISFILKEMINTIYTAKTIESSIGILQKYTYGRFMHNVKFLIQKFKNEKNKFLNLHDFPKFFLGIIKNKLFYRNQTNCNVDYDNYLRMKYLKLQSIDLMCYIYPRIYDLNKLLSDNYNYPNVLPCAKDNLEKGGIYLIDNGLKLIIYLLKNSNNENAFFDLLFAEIPYSARLNEDAVFDCDYRNESEKLIKERIKNIIEYIRSFKILFQNVLFVVEGTPEEKM